MKYLILIRHAKSSWKDMSLRDIDRPLNSRGRRDAPFMAEKLLEYFKKIDLFLVSPSVRTQLTVRKFVEKYPDAKVKTEKSIYEGYTSTLEDVIYTINKKHNVVAMVAHNPGFTFLANRYTLSAIDNVPTCGIVIIAFKGDKWTDFHPSMATVRNFIYPKQFKEE